MFKLNEVVPWGRSLGEYRRMFSLSDDDLARRILGCADGPASFNAEATATGCSIVSCDPLYRSSKDEIRDRIDQTFLTVMEQTRKNAAEFVWNSDLPSVEMLGQQRMSSMMQFLDDFDAGKTVGRYVDAELPHLRFEDHHFDLALCSHFLFLYSDHFSEEFHVASIQELCRVSHEVRIFPLLDLGRLPSRHVTAVTNQLREAGLHVEIQQVDYEFQRGGNEMMRIWR